MFSLEKKKKKSIHIRLILARNGYLMQTKLICVFVLINYSISTNSPLNPGVLYSVIILYV